MVNNSYPSTSASSVISDTELEQILGRPKNRKSQQKPAAPAAVTSTPVPNQIATSSERVIQNSSKLRQIIKEKSKYSASSFEKISGENGSFEIVSNPLKEDKHIISLFKKVPEQENTSLIEIVPSDKLNTSQNSVNNLENPSTTFNKVSKTDSIETLKSKTLSNGAPGELVEHPEVDHKQENSEENPSLSEEQYSVSFESDPNIENNNSMKRLDGEYYHKVTVSTQTNESEPENLCKCNWRMNTSCDCNPRCNCPECHCGLTDKEVNNSDETSESAFENYTDTSNQTADTVDYNHTCECKSHWPDYDITDALSDNSDESYSTSDFLDLPYQNNEEYLQLLRELEKKLIARNRERVRKTMMEFEKRSRQNQNLEKPVFDYNDDNASLLCKLGTKSPRCRKVCCRCGKNKRLNAVNSDIMQNEKRWDELRFVQSIVQNSDPNVNQHQDSSRIERSMHKSHWQLDPRSGEWIKMSCFQQTDYSRHPPFPHGDFLKDHKKKNFPVKVHKKECHCCQKKRR